MRPRRKCRTRNSRGTCANAYSPNSSAPWRGCFSCRAIYVRPRLCLNIVMDLVEHFARLFAYDAWANREVLANFHAAEPPPRALQWMAHVLASQRLWMERLEQKPQTLPVWPEFTIAQCESETAALSLLWKNYLFGRSEADLANLVSYQNSKGEAWSSRKDDILMHVITHSAYHRGQVAAAVRAGGSTPAYTDFIHSIRQGFVK